jgi:hypothetical protein
MGTGWTKFSSNVDLTMRIQIYKWWQKTIVDLSSSDTYHDEVIMAWDTKLRHNVDDFWHGSCAPTMK